MFEKLQARNMELDTYQEDKLTDKESLTPSNLTSIN